MAREVQLTLDCADPAALSRFWIEALGYRLEDPPEGFESWEQALTSAGVPPENLNDFSALADPEGRGPRLLFQRVPEAKRVKNRLHFDIRAAPGITGGDARMAALEAEADRLVSHGATRIERHEPAPPLLFGHIVLADPEGNEFCLD